jgi:UDP-N-acetylmuramoylalanine--D-glutamate ligase
MGQLDILVGYSVLGIARSGLAAANWLAGRGLDVLASDLRPLKDWPIDQLHPDVKIAAGENNVRAGDVVVISPGIKPGSETWNLAHALGSEVISDIELFARLCPCPIVAITGTDGKTTTTTMIGEIFRQAGRHVIVAGNIGNPVMGELDNLTPASVAVIEVSCFQLTHIYSLRPRVTVLTNIAKDHVDYHGSFEAYIQAKQRILQAQGPGDMVVWFAEDPILKTWEFPAGVVAQGFGLAEPGPGAWCEAGLISYDLGNGPRGLLPVDELQVIGGHNWQNVQAAALATMALGISPAVIADTMKGFPGVEHRMELVAEVSGVRYYNDTKATNPHAAETVLNALEGGIILLAGGSEKGSDFSSFGQLIAKKTKAVVLNGQTRERLGQSIPAGHPVHMTETLEEAVSMAHELASAGDLVVLAPACASFDQFKDFEHRGREFKRWVKALVIPGG